MSAPTLAYVEQPADEVSYHLLRGEVDPARFTVLATRQVSYATIRFELAIVGQSHVARFRVGDHTTSEVMACMPDPGDLGPGSPCGRNASFAVAEPLGPHHVAQAQVTTRPLDEQVRRQLARLLTDPNQAERRLSWRFPDPRGGDDGALTLLWWDADAPRLHTAHTYPNDGLVVFSQTTIASTGAADGAAPPRVPRER